MATTYTSARAARKALTAFEKSLRATDWEGDITDSHSVIKHIEDNGIKVKDGTLDNYRSALKALTAEVSPDGLQCLVMQTEGEASMETEEDPEEDPAVAKQLALAVKEIRKLKGEVDTMKGAEKARDTISVNVPNAWDWEDKKSRGTNVFRSPGEAYAFGLKTIAESDKLAKLKPDMHGFATKKLSEMGYKGNATSPLTAGGFLTQETFDSRIIDNQRQWGIASQALEVVSMPSDQHSRPRNLGGLQVYYPGEGQTPSRSQLAGDKIKLNAHKAFALVDITDELRTASIVGIGELVASELARTFAAKEDDILFNGTGETADGHMNGLAASFGVSTATSDARSVTGGDTMFAHTIPQLTQLRAKVDTQFLPGAAWYCSSAGKANIFERLAGTAGGLGMMEIAGKQVDTFHGYPIFTTYAMNFDDDTGGDVVDVYFGNLAMAGMLGIRKELEIRTSDEAGFLTDEVITRGIKRHDIVLYETGTTAQAGAVVALWQT